MVQKHPDQSGLPLTVEAEGATFGVLIIFLLLRSSIPSSMEIFVTTGTSAFGHSWLSGSPEVTIIATEPTGVIRGPFRKRVGSSSIYDQ